MMPNKPIDHILLREALVDWTTWQEKWKENPDNLVNVQMTYEDLKIICDCVKDVAEEMKKEMKGID